MFSIIYALKVAKEYYNEDTFHHTMRVAGNVSQSDRIPKDQMKNSIILAIMHDLLEDTDFQLTIKPVTDEEEYYVNLCLKLLTRNKNDNSYEQYLKKIKENFNRYPEAYWVKMSDIKDHLEQSATLTDNLKEKYLKGLPYLL